MANKIEQEWTCTKDEHASNDAQNHTDHGRSNGRPFPLSIVMCILNNVSLCVTQKLLIIENIALVFVIGIEVHVYITKKHLCDRNFIEHS